VALQGVDVVICGAASLVTSKEDAQLLHRECASPADGRERDVAIR
jgi:hypothetical protein